MINMMDHIVHYCIHLSDYFLILFFKIEIKKTTCIVRFFEERTEMTNLNWNGLYIHVRGLNPLCCSSLKNSFFSFIYFKPVNRYLVHLSLLIRFFRSISNIISITVPNKISDKKLFFKKQSGGGIPIKLPRACMHHLSM